MQLCHLTPDSLDLRGQRFRCDFNGQSMQQPLNPEFQPLIAYKTTPMETPILLSGFRVLSHWQLRHRNTFPVLLYNREDVPDKLKRNLNCSEKNLPWLVRLALLDPFQYTDLEVTALLHRATSQLACDPNRLVNFFPRLKSMENRRFIIKTSRLPEAIIRRFDRLKLDIRKSALLAELPQVIRPAAVTLFCILTRSSLSRLRQCLELVDTISLREKCSPVTVMHQLRNRIKNQQEPDGVFMVNELKARRWPSHHRYTTEFNAIVSALALTDNTHLSTDPNFESDAITLHVTADTAETMQKNLEYLADQQPVWKQLFKHIHGIPNDEVP